MTDDHCSKLVLHLSRIQGQIEALKGYIASGRSCEEVAHLTRSILTSFSSVRSGIIENSLLSEMKEDGLTPQKRTRFQSILALYKS